jgi:hypothetical protein
MFSGWTACSKVLTDPHSSMQRPRDLVILLNARTASEDLRKPKLSDRSFHVANLALRQLGSSNPLRGFSPNTTDHVGMSESLRGSLCGLDVEGGRDRLSNPRMQRRSSTWNDEGGVDLISRSWPLTSCRADEVGVVPH